MVIESGSGWKHRVHLVPWPVMGMKSPVKVCVTSLELGYDKQHVM